MSRPTSATAKPAPHPKVADTDWSGQAGMDRVIGDGNRNWSDLPARKWLAIGDVAALTLFAYVGRASHGDGSIGLDVVATALPFVAGETP